MKCFLTFSFTLLLSLTTGFTFLRDNFDEESELNKFLVRLLHKYHGFLFVFHVDRETESFVNDIVRRLGTNGALVSLEVYNYDKLHIEVDEFVRPGVPNILNLLFPKNISYWHWLNGYNKINHNDVIVFVAENWNLRERIVEDKLRIIKFAGKILLLESLGKSIRLYKTCFYCGNMSKVFVRANDMANEPLLNNFLDLNGHLIRVIFIPNFPFLQCSQTTKLLRRKEEMTVCLALIGIEGHMIRVISKKMKFRFVAFMLGTNTTYVELLKYVNSTTGDLAIGAITLSLDRKPLIEFTQPYHSEAYTFVYKFTMSFAEIFETFLEPFQPRLGWVLFLVSMVVLSVVLYLILRIHKKTVHNQITFRMSFWTLCKISVEQSVENINSVYGGLSSAGLVLALWWCCCLVFCTMYKTMLLSAMVYPENREPEGLNQLLTVGYRIVGNKQSSDIISDLFNVSDKMYSETMKNIDFGLNTCDTFVKVIDERAAMLDEQSTILYGLRRKCPEPAPAARERLRVTRYPIRLTSHAWATQLGAPYRPALDRYLGLILSGGLFVKWQRDDTALGLDNRIPLSREKRNQHHKPLPLRVFQPLFVVYGAGIILATFCFGTEVFYHMYQLYDEQRNLYRWYQTMR